MSKRTQMTVRPWRLAYCLALVAGTFVVLGWEASVPVFLMGIDYE